MEMIKLLDGNDDKAVLLVSDAAFYATPFMVEKFRTFGIENIYVAEDAVRKRKINLSRQVEVVNYDRMVELILEDEERVVAI
jgi:sulfur relay protein TusB/DsrH